mmetsp:Transcript_18654/g.30423  ORF Transcript_18654/g.30423 Transcript_18654/m.30423 type:complete len:207 (-) Transcript_18654:1203-1823(-)|eukprot:CAMPEP_0203763472 /NCGR_PEP_ID=MMETSP0098-20131031/16270_1 /ASSEMBLY_ACC=CAM_ASM_000208 /TAXON_ID=96639 /ORGANISM=" , Strain NY0313808BC1" /LENGTH=206 /DNA_ID=CAMNT_0050658347 /DNA_START=416 /DNA_END=1036 /DNA_ORIENTATION=-
MLHCLPFLQKKKVNSGTTITHTGTDGLEKKIRHKGILSTLKKRFTSGNSSPGTSLATLSSQKDFYEEEEEELECSLTPIELAEKRIASLIENLASSIEIAAAYASLGQTYAVAGNFDLAIENYSLCLSYSPNNIQHRAHFKIAKTKYEKLKQKIGQVGQISLEERNNALDQAETALTLMRFYDSQNVEEFEQLVMKISELPFRVEV